MFLYVLDNIQSEKTEQNTTYYIMVLILTKKCI